MMFNTDGNKTLCNKISQDMAIVTNRGTSQIWTMKVKTLSSDNIILTLTKDT